MALPEIFLQAIQVCGIEAQAQEILKGAELSRVDVDPLAKSWTIHLKAKSHLSRACLHPLEEHFIKTVAGLRDFRIILEGERELNQSYWENLLNELKADYPSCRGWLNGSTVELLPGRVQITVNSKLGLEYIQKKGLAGYMETKVQQEIGRPWKVDFLAGEDLPAAAVEDHLEEELKAKVQEVVFSLENRQPPVVRENAGEVILGRSIKEEPVPVSAITEEEKTVVVQGEVFNLEVKKLKSGRSLVTFALTDYTDSITVKWFEKNDAGFTNQFAEGDWVKVRGGVQEDKFSQELTLGARDLERVARPLRQDLASAKRVELHLHTQMSALDGLTGINDAVAAAARFGHPALAITDHGVVQGFPDAYEAGRQYGVKILYGLEGYLVEGGPGDSFKKQQSYHLIILAVNQQGLANLYRLVSAAHLKYFYRKPRIPRDLLEEHRQGLILGTACEAGELFRAILEGKSWPELTEIASFYDYLEIQPLANNHFLIENGRVAGEEELKNLNRRVVELGEALHKPVVATGDVHFLNPQDGYYRQIIQAGQGYAEETQAPLYFKTTDEMLREFSYLGPEKALEVVVLNPRAIAEKIEELKPIPDRLYPPKIEGAETQITQMAWARAREIYGDPLPEPVESRLVKELDSIVTHGFAVLYLIAQKLVAKSNQDGYLVGSRGSVGSSLVATMTGITEVNPLLPHYYCPNCHYSEFVTGSTVASGFDLPGKLCPRCGSPLQKDGQNIPFEVFLGFKGDKVPDIDLNFSGDYQPRAHKYVEELFGKERVFRAGTIATIAQRTAYGFVKKFIDEKNQVLRSAEIDRLVKGVSGVKRTTGQHPGGLMIVPQDLDVHMFTPLQHPADAAGTETVTTHFDYHSISSRLVKLDILGHDDPTAIKMLEDLTGLDARSIPLDDAPTMSLFSSVEALKVTPAEIKSPVGTYGIPEFGTRFVRQMLEDTRPGTFGELVRISGFSHGTDVWLNNAQDLIRSKTCTLKEAISCRDDIMTYLLEKGLEPADAFKIMENVRKGKGLKPEHEELMRRHQVPEWYLASCRKIKYMFPKAHAVAYVTMAFRIAYFKVHYPEAFYATFFTVRAEAFDADVISRGPEAVLKEIEALESKENSLTAKEKNLLTVLEVALEMYRRGIKMAKVDLKRSAAHQFLISAPQTLLTPFAALPGVGRAAAEAIIAARAEREFTSVEDLQERGKVAKQVLEVLNHHGCLEDLPLTNQLSLF